MVEEAIQALAVSPGGRYIDATVNGGGHAAFIIEHSSPGGQLLGIDADPVAIATAQAMLATSSGSVRLVNDNFANLEAVCLKTDFFPVHGIFFDLGLSSLQLAGNDRGFSFQREASLDMRLSPDQKLTANDIVNNFSEASLARLIRTYGEERQGQKIAHQIIARRPLRTTLELAAVVEQACGGRRGRIHPATKTFQALRIAVNRELENLETALRQAVNLLGADGRLVVISYHSLEDRIVKRFILNEAKGCICPPEKLVCVCGHTPRLRLITRKVVTPSRSEIIANPRSRSARMRAATRIINQEEIDESSERLFFLAREAAGSTGKPTNSGRTQRSYSLS
jgi:16S rRNA (cytosine1402-N4)-methyltransferase